MHTLLLEKAAANMSFAKVHHPVLVGLVWKSGSLLHVQGQLAAASSAQESIMLRLQSAEQSLPQLTAEAEANAGLLEAHARECR